MTITERDRRDLFDGLEQVLGPNHTETLMQLLPHQPADELVTISYFQTEMGAFRTEMRGEMGDLRTELKGEMGDLRTELKGEMTELRIELKGEMSELRGEMSELRGEMSELRGEMGELKGDMLGLRGEFAAHRADTRADITEKIAALNVSINRRITALAATNVVAVVTALIT